VAPAAAAPAADVRVQALPTQLGHLFADNSRDGSSPSPLHRAREMLQKVGRFSHLKIPAHSSIISEILDSRYEYFPPPAFATFRRVLTTLPVPTAPKTWRPSRPWKTTTWPRTS